MEPMICPECRGRLVAVDNKTARCTVHGGEYSILYWNGEVPAPAAAPVSVASGSQQETSTRVELASRAETEVSGPASDTATPVPPHLVSVMCAGHPQVQAIGRCSACNTPVCATCDFPVPMTVGGAGSVLSLGNQESVSTHVCPQCAANPSSNKLSKRRKTYLVFSYIMGACALLAFAAVFSGAFHRVGASKEEQEAMNSVLGLLMFWPSVAGTVLGAMSLDRRLGNPPVAWAAAICNGVMLATVLILTVIGIAAK